MKVVFMVMIICLQLLLFNLPGQKVAEENIEEWKGNDEQKLWGLMTVWAQVKFSFPYPEKLKELNWDETTRNLIPSVLEAQSMEEYYKLLMELVAGLNDSHTFILPPWGRLVPGYDIPPVEIMVIDNKFYISRVGGTEEMKSQQIYPGLEVLEVGEHVPVRKFFNENVLKYYTRGSSQADESTLLFYLLYGIRGEKVSLTVKDTNGNIRNVELSRNSLLEDGKPFMYQFLESMFTSTIISEMIGDNVLYVNIPNFQSENEQISIDFHKLIDSLDISNLTGMIIDVRQNLGGSDKIMENIVCCLIDKSVRSPVNHFFHYVPANIPWGKEPLSWTARKWEVTPREGRRYHGPLVILTGPATHSAAEDFVIELMQRKKTLIAGERTSGGAGGKLSISLPAGGELAVSTFKATLPDGTEYLGTGLIPDIEVHPTRDNIIQGRDGVLEKGLEVIQNWALYQIR